MVATRCIAGLICLYFPKNNAQGFFFVSVVYCVSQGFFFASVIDFVSHLIINKSKYSNQGLFCTGRLDSFIHHHQKKKKNNNSCLLLGQVTQVVLPSLAAFRLFGLWSPSPPLLHTRYNNACMSNFIC
jgi:hypothetical protein